MTDYLLCLAFVSVALVLWGRVCGLLVDYLLPEDADQ